MRTEVQRLVRELPGAGIARAVRLGLELAPQLDFEAWRLLVTHLARLARTTTGVRQTLTAWLGDALAYGEIRYRGRIVTCASEAGPSRAPCATPRWFAPESPCHVAMTP
jgi:hypothetical protein